LRPVLYVAALLFGAATGLLRMSFGGHFLSDVLGGGLITLAVIALLRRLFRLRTEPQRESQSCLPSPARESPIEPIP
jgi:membrane-associated phospholipid phosphatase